MYQTRTRLTPEQRKRQIVDAAVKDALERGVFYISLASVAKRLNNCSKSTVRGYFTVTKLRSAVVEYAFEWMNYSFGIYDTILTHAIIMKHPAVKMIPDHVKQRLLKSIL